MHRIALKLARLYPFVWPVIFVLLGLITLTGTHIHFKVLGLEFTNHALMWILMGFAHADIFWRSWRMRQEKADQSTNQIASQDTGN